MLLLGGDVAAVVVVVAMDGGCVQVDAYNG